ncbi:response regulator [Paenibacillus sp. P96]|uniref:Response regulator n=1 Tax=Paenibacillus zeirhizosphaerae TaxID=2987519 RepID=A0ABT9FTT1_9BACL|nr:response regulator [Paenibacillus sp. P96]MDP4098148.1 response regulator [Paenibacillus sp. P96]
MYKVLIIDDEIIVRQAVKSLIRWDGSDFTYAGAASNGKNAMEMLSRTGADIVITDIKMPEMDGIELIKRMKAAGFDGETLVLSNYNDFELVREALKQGAYDYLLKLTLKTDNFMKVLGEMKDRLDERRSERPKRLVNAAESIPAQPHNDARAIRAALAVLDREVEALAGDADRRDSREEECVCFTGEAMRIYLFIVRISDDEQQRRARDFDQALETLASALFTGSSWAYAVQTAELRFILAVAYPDGASAIDPRESAVRLISLTAMYHGVPVHVVYAAPASNREGLIKELLRLRGTEPVLFYKALGEGGIPSDRPTVNAGDEEFRKAEALLHDTVPGPSQTEIERWAYAAYRLIDAAAACWLHPFALKRVLNGGIWSAVNAAELRCREELDASPWLKRVEDAASDQELKQAVGELAAEIAVLADEDREPYPLLRTEVRAALLYLEAHYADRVSIGDVAAHVGLSEPYLCQLFKAETGRGIVAQLNEIRMKKAYELLASGRYLVKQASFEVGIHDPFYFNRLFKKRFGISPKKVKQQ